MVAACEQDSSPECFLLINCHRVSPPVVCVLHVAATQGFLIASSCLGLTGPQVPVKQQSVCIALECGEEGLCQPLMETEAAWSYELAA